MGCVRRDVLGLQSSLEIAKLNFENLERFGVFLCENLCEKIAPKPAKIGEIAQNVQRLK